MLKRYFLSLLLLAVLASLQQEKQAMPQISKVKVFTGCMTSPEHGLVYGEGDADIETLGRAAGHVFPPFWRSLKSPFF